MAPVFLLLHRREGGENSISGEKGKGRNRDLHSLMNFRGEDEGPDCLYSNPMHWGKRGKMAKEEGQTLLTSKRKRTSGGGEEEEGKASNLSRGEKRRVTLLVGGGDRGESVLRKGRRGGGNPLPLSSQE